MSTLFALLFYVATILLVGGTGMKVLNYARIPAPLMIPVSPAPRTPQRRGHAHGPRGLVFQSLFKSNKWIWVLGFLFHWGMLLVLLRHLRHFTQPVW